MDDRGIGFRFPVGVRDTFLLHSAESGAGAHSGSCLPLRHAGIFINLVTLQFLVKKFMIATVR
jgi:hypothetical protein